MIYSYNFYFDLKINNLGKWKLGVTNLVIDYLSEKMNLAMRIKSSINGWNWLLPLDKPRIQYKGSSEIFLWKLKETPHYLYPLCLFLFHPVTRRSHHHCQGKKKTSDMIVSWETYRRRIHVADNKIDFPSNTSTVIPRSGRNGWWSILLAILPIKWTTTPFEPPKGLPLNTRIFSLLVYVDLVCVVYHETGHGHAADCYTLDMNNVCNCYHNMHMIVWIKVQIQALHTLWTGMFWGREYDFYCILL